MYLYSTTTTPFASCALRTSASAVDGALLRCATLTLSISFEIYCITPINGLESALILSRLCAHHERQGNAFPNDEQVSAPHSLLTLYASAHGTKHASQHASHSPVTLCFMPPRSTTGGHRETQFAHIHVVIVSTLLMYATNNITAKTVKKTGGDALFRCSTSLLMQCFSSAIDCWRFLCRRAAAARTISRKCFCFSCCCIIMMHLNI